MKIALTFDDGPNVEYTDMLLGVLAYHKVRATFFMIGKFVVERPDIVVRVANSGHQIGNHTMNHPKLTELNGDYVYQEIWQCENALTKFIGSRHAKLFRPPYMLTSRFIEEVAIGYGLKTVAYHAAAGDGEQRDPQDHFEKVVRELGDKDGIVLMHDGCHGDIAASRLSTILTVETLIKHYKAQGCEFVGPAEI